HRESVVGSDGVCSGDGGVADGRRSGADLRADGSATAGGSRPHLDRDRGRHGGGGGTRPPGRGRAGDGGGRRRFPSGESPRGEDQEGRGADPAGGPRADDGRAAQHDPAPPPGQRERRVRAGDGDAAGERAQEAAGEAARSARRQRCTRARSRLRGVDQPRDLAGRRWGAGGASPVTEGGGGRPDPGAGRAPPGGEVVSREARALLDRYLRQRRELGETELVLGDRSVRELDLGTPPAVPQRENTAPRPTRQAAPAPPSEAQALAL